MQLNDTIFSKLLFQASESPRKRSHLNIHKELDEPVQRLCIGLKKGTYVRPHHHPKSNKWELMLTLRGSVALVILEADGTIKERLLLDPNNASCGIEIEPNTWHTLYPLTDEAVILEVKEGPYTPAEPSDFASWAPEEGSKQVPHFLSWLENATQGEKYEPQG